MANGNNIGDEIREQRAKLKHMKTKERLEYIWIYYRYHIFWTVLGIIIAANLINVFFFTKNQALTFGMVNTMQGPENKPATEKLKLDFIDYAKIEEGSDEITFDTQLLVYYYENGIATDMSYASVAKLITTLGSGEMDALLTNVKELDSYAMDGVFDDLASLIDSDLFEKLKSQGLVHYCTTDDGDEVAAGIELTGNKKLTENGLYSTSDELYFAIPVAADNKELATSLLLFFLDV